MENKGQGQTVLEATHRGDQGSIWAVAPRKNKKLYFIFTPCSIPFHILAMATLKYKHGFSPPLLSITVFLLFTFLR
jgi:hypothetical protein